MQSQIDEILENIAVTFPGYTMVNCLGFWKDQKQTYRDDNLQIIIDTLPSKNADTTTFFSNLKEELCQSLGQEKIYVTKTGNREELITFKEFFAELGLEIQTSDNSEDENLKLAEQIVITHDFILKRLKDAISQYENNQLDTIALLQTKARTNDVKNRAMVRQMINRRRSR